MIAILCRCQLLGRDSIQGERFEPKTKEVKVQYVYQVVKDRFDNFSLHVSTKYTVVNL